MKSVYVLASELSALRLLNFIGGSVRPAPGGPLWRLCLSLKELGLVDRSGGSFLLTDLGLEVIDSCEQQPMGARVFIRLADVTVSAEAGIPEERRQAVAGANPK